MADKLKISGLYNPRVNEAPLYELKIGTKTTEEENNVVYRWVMCKVGVRKPISSTIKRKGVATKFRITPDMAGKKYDIVVYECTLIKDNKTNEDNKTIEDISEKISNDDLENVLKNGHKDIKVEFVDKKTIEIPEEKTTRHNIEPEILEVHLMKEGEGSITKVSYQDTLIAFAKTQGLQGKKIHFHLWENDKQENDSKHSYSTKEFSAEVEADNIARLRIPLITHQKTLQYLANRYLPQGANGEGTEHEFCVTASFGILEKHSNEVQVKREIQKAYFVDKDKNKITKIEVGDVIQVCIESTGMIGAAVKYTIWEKDGKTKKERMEEDDPVYQSGLFYLWEDQYYCNKITVDKEFFERGKYLWEGDSESQNYSIEVHTFRDSKKSKPFELVYEDVEVKYGNSPVKVKVGEKNKEEEKKVEADKEFLPLLQLKKINKVVNNKDKQVINLYENQSKKISICVDKDKKTEFEQKKIWETRQYKEMTIFLEIDKVGTIENGYIFPMLNTLSDGEKKAANELQKNFEEKLQSKVEFKNAEAIKVSKDSKKELKIKFKGEMPKEDIYLDIFSSKNSSLNSGNLFHRMKITLLQMDTNTIYITRRWEERVEDIDNIYNNDEGYFNPYSATFGTFTFDDLEGYICEPYRDDETRRELDKRIPKGDYNAIWHSSEKFPKTKYVYKNYPKLENGFPNLYNNSVPFDRRILIHAGTIGKDSEGCILPGAVITKNKNGKITAIGRSIDTFYKIINKIKEKKGLENIKIKITNEIEDEYSIKQQIKKEDGDKERAKEERRKKKEEKRKKK